MGRERPARLAAIGTGAALLVYGFGKTVEAFFALTGFGLWLVLGAALVALFAPLLASRDR
jgi:hypothetical protein